MHKKNAKPQRRLSPIREEANTYPKMFRPIAFRPTAFRPTAAAPSTAFRPTAAAPSTAFRPIASAPTTESHLNTEDCELDMFELLNGIDNLDINDVEYEKALEKRPSAPTQDQQPKKNFKAIRRLKAQDTYMSPAPVKSKEYKTNEDQANILMPPVKKARTDDDSNEKHSAIEI